MRIHPLDSIDPIKKYIGLPNIHIEYGSSDLKIDPSYNKGHHVEMKEKDMVNMKQSLQYCDVCVNIASTVTIEAFVFDTPVVNISFAGVSGAILRFLHYRPIVEAGAVKVADTMEDVGKYVKMYLADPTLDQKARKKIVDLFIKPTDGYSYKRSVDFLDTIIKNSRT